MSSNNNVMSEKKMVLMAHRANILEEIKYFDTRIVKVRSQGLKNSLIEDADSSDSEEEFPFTVECGPSVPQLKLQQVLLKTCVQATQELTSVQVLQSEVNVLVESPEFVGEPPVTEPGVWREVTAECRVDLVPFSITYFVHQPDRQFGLPSYRGLRLVPVKSAHEGELSKSVMPSLTRPSDAVEVLKSYAAAQRSRRTTLARLADKYANMLFMEPMADGGYILKCANLLEVSWFLQNKWSPIAPFHHSMKFDLEYMDASYIKNITQIHRQLCNPSIDTDERTLLLARIISICLEAQGPTQELYEIMSSEPEVAESLKRRRTTLDQEPKAPSSRHSGEAENLDARSDREVMAPPKSLPKKAKPKGKENMGDNRKEKLKRGNSDENMNENKKLKKDSDINLNTESNPNEKFKKSDKTAEKAQNKPTENKNDNTKDKKIDKVNVAGNKNSEIPKILKKNTVKAKADKVENKVASNKNVVKRPESGKVVQKTKKTKEKSDVANTRNIQKAVRPEKVIEKAKSNLEKVDKVKIVASASEDNIVNVESNKDTKDTIKKKAIEKVKNIASAKPKESTNATSKETVTKITKKSQDQDAINPKNAISKIKPTSAKETVKSIKSNEITKKKEVLPKKVLNTEKNLVTNAVDRTKKVTTVKNKATSESNINIQEKVPTKPIARTNDKVNKENNDKIKKTFTKNRVNNTNKNKESTIEKVVQKSVATKRKSNIVDREPEDIDSVPKIKRKTLSNPEIIRNKDIIALNRKSSLLDRVKEIDSVAKKNTQISEKKMPSNNNDKMKKSKTDPIIKMQKPIKNRIESRIKTKLMPGSIRTSIPGNTKVLRAGNTEKQIGLTSKIPQKKLSAISEATMKKNPLRISPRKISSKFKTTVDGTKSIQKTTGIPRLLKKPIRKL